MAVEMDAVKRVTNFIAYLAGGLVSLLMAIAASKGVTFSSAGGFKARPPSDWYVYPISSINAQILLTGFFAVVGFWLLWMAYKKSKKMEKRHNLKKKKEKRKKRKL